MQRNDRSCRHADKAANRRAAVAEKRKAELFAKSLAGRVATAARCPLERCARPGGLFEAGLGTVVIGRRLPSGLIAAGFFLVDVWCLGVKHASFDEITRAEFDEKLADLDRTDRLVDMEPACARKLLAGAVAFAAKSTFQPARDFVTLRRLFGEAGAEDCREEFVFGRDGVPTYLDTSGDSFTRGREIIATLERVHGEDGWDVISDTSLTSTFGRMKALIGAYRDHPGLKALQQEIEAFDTDAGLVVEHDPDEGASPSGSAADDASVEAGDGPLRPSA